MYICFCGKGHNISEEQMALIPEKELRLKHDCGFDIIIGGDDHGEYNEETGDGGIYMYSQDVKDIYSDNKEERLANAVEAQSEMVDIWMKCGHPASWRGFTASNICCGDCGWDKNGRNSGNKTAWEQDYERMYPELHKEAK